MRNLETETGATVPTVQGQIQDIGVELDKLHKSVSDAGIGRVDLTVPFSYSGKLETGGSWVYSPAIAIGIDGAILVGIGVTVETLPETGAQFYLYGAICGDPNTANITGTLLGMTAISTRVNLLQPYLDAQKYRFKPMDRVKMAYNVPGSSYFGDLCVALYFARM